MLDKCRLLHGPYQAPALRVGDRADCLMPGTVVITSWTDARINWPRCRRPVGNSHPSLLLDGELARAVRTEASAAVMHWWGLSTGVVHRWRKFLDVTRTNNPRSRELLRASAQAGAPRASEAQSVQQGRPKPKVLRHPKPKVLRPCTVPTSTASPMSASGAVARSTRAAPRPRLPGGCRTARSCRRPASAAGGSSTRSARCRGAPREEDCRTACLLSVHRPGW
jgi:hypothetical protein